MKKYLLIIVPLIIIIRFLIPSEKTEVEEIKEVNNISTVSVEKINIIDFKGKIISFSELEPSKKINLFSNKKTKINKINYKEGDFINEGDIIIELEISDLLARKKALEVTIKTLEKEVDSNKKLLKINSISELILMNSIANLENEKSNLVSLEKEINDSTIKSPISGFLENFDFEVSEYIKIDQHIADIVNNKTLETTSYISSKYINLLKVGDNIDIKLNDKILDGEISFISQFSNNETNTFKVKTKIKNSLDLPSGMPVQVIFYPEVYKGFEISPYLLNSHNNEDFFVKYITEDEIVKYLDVEFIQTSDNGVWVSIKEDISEINLITLGHILIKENQKVKSNIRDL